jgi:hypothetical protein
MYFLVNILNQFLVVWIMTPHIFSYVVRPKKFCEKIAAQFLVAWADFYRKIVLISCIETTAGCPMSGREDVARSFAFPVYRLNALQNPLPCGNQPKLLVANVIFVSRIFSNRMVHRLDRNIINYV